MVGVSRQIPRVRQGLSLPEVLISMAILAIVLAIALPFLVTVERTWRAGSAETQATDTARAGALLMGHQARQARRLLYVSDPSDTSGRLLFETVGPDGDPHVNEFYYQPDSPTSSVGAVRLRDQNLRTGAESDAVFAGPVTSLQFAAFEADGLSATTDPWRTGLVEAIFHASSPDGRAAASALAAVEMPADAPLFAVFSAGTGRLDVQQSARVEGDVYCGGDLVLAAGCRVQDGLVYAAGSSFGTDMIVAPAPQPSPSLPALDTSFYDGLLAQAAAQPAGDRLIDKQSEVVDFGSLPERTLLCNGDVTIDGPVTVTGPGTIVATDDIWVTGPARLEGQVNLVAADGIALDGNVSMPDQPFCYAGAWIWVNKDKRVDAHLVSGQNVYVTDRSRMHGIIYARGRAHLECSVTGAVYAERVCHLREGDFVLDESLARQEVPGLALW